MQRLLEQSGLKYSMHSAGTTLGMFGIMNYSFKLLACEHTYAPNDRYTEGPWDRVHHVIGQAHSLLHQQGVLRIQSDIRSGSRTDKEQSFDDKVNKVKELLAKDQHD